MCCGWWRKVSPPAASGKAGGKLVGKVECQAGFARFAGSGEGEQPGGVAGNKMGLEVRNGRFPTHKTGQRMGQIAKLGVGRGGRNGRFCLLP